MYFTLQRIFQGHNDLTVHTAMMFIRLQLKLLINLVGNSLNSNIRRHNELSKLWFHYETKKVLDLLQELCDITTYYFAKTALWTLLYRVAFQLALCDVFSVR